MVDTVDTRVDNDGHRNYVATFTNISDATGESAVTKIDVSALAKPCDDVKITKIKYQTSGFGVRILWDATADDLAFEIPENQEGEICFGESGLINPQSAGATGDVKFTTIGTAAAGDSYTIKLYCKKKYD